MKTSKKALPMGRTVLALAVLGMIGTAQAQSDEVTKLTTPESWLGGGIGLVSGNQRDRSIFGQYNGMRQDDAYLLFDFDYVKRNNATGNWTTFSGHNIGLDTREFTLDIGRQGDWRLKGDYNEIVHREIRTVNTGMSGVGTTTPVVNRLAVLGTGSDYNFKMKRQGLGLSGEKWINRSLQVQVNFKSEDKDGTRLWGRGYECATGVCNRTQSATASRWSVLMLPEPVHSNIKQFEAKLNYSTKKLFLSGGYYGSFYTNDNGNLTATVTNPLSGPTGLPVTAGAVPILNLPMALQPDNQAHQFYLDGNYAFTPTTKANFRLSYTHATQHESFAGMGLADGTQPTSDLGGVLDTTLAQFGISAHPWPKLRLRANVRYEDKSDKTPLAVYNTESGTTWTNSPTSERKTKATVEGSYLFPGNLRATVGADYNEIQRALPAPGVQVAGFNGLRGKTHETTIRGELRRSISDTLIGAVSLAHSERKGSDWFNLCTNGACTAAGLVYGGMYSNSTLNAATGDTGAYPYMLADRNRDKIRLSADWTATERLSFGFAVEDNSDHYSPPSSAGLHKSDMTLYSVDATFQINDYWKLTGYLSQVDQTIHTGQNTGYRATLKDENTAFGLGLVGKPNSKLEVGGKLSYIDDVNKYRFGIWPGNTNANAIAQVATYGGLPDVTYRETRLNLYGKYALQKNADIRIDFVHFNARLNEYSWGTAPNQFFYSDGTTVSINPDQTVNYIGATYIYKMQ